MTPSEFETRLADLNEEGAATINPSVRAQTYTVVILALLDGAKANAGHRESCTEDEFVSFCRRVYRKCRAPLKGAS